MRIKFIQKIIDLIRGKNESIQALPLPHPQKMEIVKQFFVKNKCKIFVETGTYLGETTESLSGLAKKVYTIELSEELWAKACEKFKNQNHVVCLKGDSTQILIEVLKQIDSKPLFWLDGHYSSGITAKGDKDTPINEELLVIYNSKIRDAVILIDDARCFGVEKDYPTIEDLRKKVESLWGNVEFENKNDIISIKI